MTDSRAYDTLSATNMTVLRVRLFGPLELIWGNEPLTLPSSSKTRSLLAYLVFHPNRPISRDLLAGLFWPEQTNARARRALSNALWQICRALGPAADHLRLERDSIAFVPHPHDELDVAVFEAKAQLEPNEALSLYRADLLEGDYYDWTLLERERLRELYLTTLERLIDVHKQHGNYSQALACAQRLVTADPLRETAHCELMRLYHLLGRSQAALEQFRLLCDLLAKELEIAPAPASVALYKEVRATLQDSPAYLPVAPPPPPLLRDLAHLPFIGRADERAALLDALQSAACGQGELALVEGDAGTGKTRLVGEIIANAQWRGFQVGLSKADSSTTPTPYRSVQVALAPLLTPLRVAQLAELVEPLWLSVVVPLFPAISEYLLDLPHLAPLAPQEEQRRLCEGLARTLVGLAAVSPLLLVLEDAHWADEATLAALPYLAASLPSSRLLLILSYRTAEAHERATVWKTLETLERALPLRRLSLSSFQRSETEALIRRAMGMAETETRILVFAGRLHDETGGNALLLVESLKSLLERGRLAPAADGAWQLPPDDAPLLPPTTVRELIGERLTRLAPALRPVLEWTAVLGEETEFPVLLSASGAEPAALALALEALKQRGFLVESETRYHFGHDRIWETAYELVAPEQRRHMHCMAGLTLERLHPERPEALAYHYEQGQAWDKAVHYHWQAGELASGLHAYPIALHHYNCAANLAQAANMSSEQRFDLLAARETTLDVLGRREEQAADVEAMASLARASWDGDPQRLAEVHRRRAWLLAHTGRYDKAAEAIQLALTLADRAGDEPGKADALTALGTMFNWSSRPDQAISHLQQAVELYRHQADPKGEIKARNTLGDTLMGVTSFAAAEAALRPALTLCQSTGDKLGEVDTLHFLGVLYMERGDIDIAITHHEHALEIAREIGYRSGEARILGNLGNLFYLQGKIAQAIEFFSTVIPIFQAMGERRLEAQARISRASVSCDFLSDQSPFFADVKSTLDYYQDIDDSIGIGQALSVMGQIALHRRRLKEARDYLEKSLALVLASGDRWVGVQVYILLARLSLEEGRPKMALQYVDEAELLCRELELADWIVVVLALRGLALLALGQPEAALAATAEAVERLTPSVAWSCLIHFWRYQVLKALERTAEARVAIEEAQRTLLKLLEGFSPEQRAMSLERVPEHRAIAAAWEAFQPQRTVLRLPHAAAPSAGRPLRADEWVQVTWTLAAPEDDVVEGKVAQRRRRLARLLREAAEQSAAPTLEALSGALGVCERTIKRDLAALRAQGGSIRTRGSQ